jgi:hypothetical protein
VLGSWLSRLLRWQAYDAPMITLAQYAAVTGLPECLP